MPATKKVSRGITSAQAKLLEEVGRKAREQGFLILDTQWMKNPILPHFFAPIMYRDMTRAELGVIRVDLRYGKPSATVMMPTEDFIDLL